VLGLDVLYPSPNFWAGRVLGNFIDGQSGTDPDIIWLSLSFAKVFWVVIGHLGGVSVSGSGV
jgi:hypothetical protein